MSKPPFITGQIVRRTKCGTVGTVELCERRFDCGRTAWVVDVHLANGSETRWYAEECEAVKE